MRASVTLGDLLQWVGGGLLPSGTGPSGLDRVVGDLLVHDPLDPPPLAPGAVLLAAGIEADDPAFLDLLARAGEASATAIVVREVHPLGRELVRGARRADVAVRFCPRGTDWAGLLEAMRSALSSLAAHDEQSEIALGDLFTLASGVAAAVGGAVSIEDPRGRVLAYSEQEVGAIDVARQQTILGRQVPAPWMARLREEGVLDALWSGSEVVHFSGAPGEGLRPRIGIAVRAGTAILGQIWVAEVDRPLDEGAEAALVEAARAAAPHLLRHRSVQDVERRQRRRALLDQLLGEAAPETPARIGIPPRTPLQVMAFSPVGEPPAGWLDRLLELLAFRCDGWSKRAVETSSVDRAYAALAVNGVAADAVRAFAGGVVAQARQTLQVPLVAAIGMPVDDLRDVAASRTAADEVLRAAETFGLEGDVIAASEVTAHLVLLKLSDLAQDHPALLAGPVPGLLASKDRTWHADTLRVWLDTFGDPHRGAERLHLHVNSYRYRAARLAEVTGLDLDDPVVRLVTHLQLWLA